MSETEKPAEILSTTAGNGTGPPKNSGGETITEKMTEVKVNGTEKAAVGETGTHEDVKMTDATDVKIGEQDKEGNGGEVKPVKGKGEEKEMAEIKDGLEAPAEEDNAVVQEKNMKDHDKTEVAGGKIDGAEGKNKVGNEEKSQGFVGKCEETEKGEESEDKGEETEKGEESEDKGEETEKGEESEDKGEETEEKHDGAAKKNKEFGGERTAENEEEGTRKRRRGQGKGKKESGKTKGVLWSPTPSSIDRPVRERRTVERLVEVVEKEPSKALLIEKGQGTPLKDIPNVAYKLSKKRPADIKSLHQLIFGRRGKAINFKSHIFQFSGFVWHENEDKQRAKVKEKLDKCVKDKLLDLCDVFDISVSRVTSRKEDLVGKLLDFMVAPHATTDVILAEKEQSAKSRKRKRMSGRGVSMKLSEKRTKSEKISKSVKNAIDMEEEGEDGDTGEDKKNGFSDKDESTEYSQSEEEESEHDNAAKKSEYSRKGGSGAKKLLKKQSSPLTKTKKVASPKKRSQTTSLKSPRKPYSKRFKTDEAKDSPKEFPRNRKNVVTPKKKSSYNSDIGEKKTSGKKAGRSKPKTQPAEKSGPTQEELRQTVCEILKEVDFNTATFTDILKRLASHYDMDLTARKPSIKVIIQDELTKLADEADDEDDDSEDEADTEKAKNSEPAGKEVAA